MFRHIKISSIPKIFKDKVICTREVKTDLGYKTEVRIEEYDGVDVYPSNTEYSLPNLLAAGVKLDEVPLPTLVPSESVTNAFINNNIINDKTE